MLHTSKWIYVDRQMYVYKKKKRCFDQKSMFPFRQDDWQPYIKKKYVRSNYWASHYEPTLNWEATKLFKIKLIVLIVYIDNSINMQIIKIVFLVLPEQLASILLTTSICLD